jgi:hypothetical protein
MEGCGCPCIVSALPRRHPTTSIASNLVQSRWTEFPVRGTLPKSFVFSATILPQAQMPWHDSWKIYKGFRNFARNTLIIELGASWFSNPLYMQLSLNTKDFGNVPLTKG